jgi:hypothetical protein
VIDPGAEEALSRMAARPLPPPDAALLERIARILEANVRPVRPLPGQWLLGAQLVLLCATVAVAASAWAGLDGWRSLATWQRLILLAGLVPLAVIVARECVKRWIPGSLPRLGPAAVIAGSCGVLVLLFAVLFRDYRATHFIASGVGCLEQGVLHAIPAAILAALVLRRGFAVRPIAAAVTGGALAGLAGVVFLELHCPNLEAPHQLIWHTAVVPVSALLGALVAASLARLTRR